MATRRDIIGKRFGKLVVLGDAPRRIISGTRRRVVTVKCDCGIEKDILAQQLIAGQKSCGCVRISGEANPLYKHGLANAHPRLHRRWRGMHARCYNKRNTNFKNYGGRGIVICEEWHNFAIFCEWALKTGFTPQLEIDRIDPDEPYCAENCRWVPKSINCASRRDCHRVDVDGQSLPLAELAHENGMSVSTLYDRVIKRRMDVGEAIAKPIARVRRDRSGFCAHGHALTEDNVFYLARAPKYKHCRSCLNDRLARAKAKKAAIRACQKGGTP